MTQVDVIDDTVGWLARHPGLSLPTGTVEEVAFAPTSAQFSGQKWHECVLCNWVDKEGNMQKTNGKWYCNVNGCAAEVSK